MAVAFDAATESVRTGTTDPHTFTHTPVGTPRGVIITAIHGTESTALINSVTYGGVEMTASAAAADTATEPGRAYIYFLGSGIPTGPQTVSIDLTSATGTDIQFVCLTFTASGDTSFIGPGSVNNNAANPSTTLNFGTLNGMAVGALYGGGASPADFTPNGNCVTVHDHDFGNFYAEVIRSSSLQSGTFNIGGTAANDDVAFVAMGITDTANVTISPAAAPASASPAAPEGADVMVGPAAAVSMAASVAPQFSSPSAVTVTPTAAVATAAPSTPDGLDKTIGVSKATATAAGSIPSFSGTGVKTISLAGVWATAAAAPAAPEGIDLTIGPTAASAAAACVAPDLLGTGGPVTIVGAVAAQAHAHHEEEPFPWGDAPPTPSLEVSIPVSSASAAADSTAPDPQITLGLNTNASASASVVVPIVSKPIQPPAAEAAAAGGVPTDVGPDTGSRSVAPPASEAQAAPVTPEVSIRLMAPQASASAAGSAPRRDGTVPITAAAAVASVLGPVVDVTIGASAAQAVASCLIPTVVLTGSALIRPPQAIAIAACDRPRSVGIKDFVVLISRPTEDSRMLVPAGSSTLVLTPLEEQVE